MGKIISIVVVLGFCLGSGSVLLAGSEPVVVSTESKPPTEGVLFSFDDGQSESGWGWTGLEEEWRDVGMSFRSPTDGAIRKITLWVEKVPAAFLEPAKFSLRIYETQALGEKPDTGELVYEGRGEIALNEEDRDSYLTFVLGEDVPVLSGSIYTFLLAWDEPMPNQRIIFHIQPQYQEGQTWFREGRGGELAHLTQSDRPGLMFYIQEPLSNPNTKN